MISKIICRHRFLSLGLTGIRPSLHLNSRSYSVYPSGIFDPVDECTAARTSVLNPSEHKKDHIGLWYTIDKSLSEKLYGTLKHESTSSTTHAIALPKKYMEIADTINETAFMIRQPALSVIDYIKQSNLSMPPNKFMFYGEAGAGKSMSLAHVFHYLQLDGWVLVHLPWPAHWRTRFQLHKSLNQMVHSLTRPGLIDLPIRATVWLRQFRLQNHQLLSELNLKTKETHEWSKREILSAGSPLVDIIEQGLGRSRTASDCIYSLVSELKLLATSGECKVAFVCDGINTLYREKVTDKLNYKYPNAQNFTLYEAFKQFLQPDWTNGCVVATICDLANDVSDRESHLPRYLLQQNGWEALDPFVPIKVPRFSDTELTSAIDYYTANRWIQHPMINSPMGRKEIRSVTGKNAYKFIEFIQRL